MSAISDAIEAARHAIGLNLADATRAITAAAPLIEAAARADERAKVAEGIAEAIQARHDTLHADDVWENEGRHYLAEAVAIARQHAQQPAAKEPQ